VQLLKIYNKFGLLFLILGLLLGMVVLGILYIYSDIAPSYFLLFLSATIVLTVYHIISKKRLTKNIAPTIETKYNLISDNRKCRLILNIIFYIGVVVVLILIQTTDVRPVVYYILLSVLAVILVVLSLIPQNKHIIYGNILKIFVYSFIVTFAPFKYYFWSGNDTWAHAGINEALAYTGTISTFMGKEMEFPLQHVAVSISELISGVDVRFGTLIAVTIPLILVSIVLYSIVRKYVGEQYGLIAFLLCNIYPYLITWRVMGQTTSYGVLVFFPLMLLYFLVIHTNKKGNFRFLGLYLLLILILCMSHLFSSFTLLFIILGLYVGSIIVRKKLNTIELLLLVVPVIITILYWILKYNGFGSIVSILFMQTSSFGESIIGIEKYVNVIELNATMAFLNIGAIVFLFCILVLLVYLSSRDCFKKSMVSNFCHYLACTMFLMISAYFITSILFPDMSGRFLPYMAFFFAGGGAVILHEYLWHQDIKNRYYKIFLLCLIVFIVSLLCLSSSIITQENPIWMPQQASDALTISEARGLETGFTYISTPESKIITDSGNIRPMSYFDYHTHHTSTLVMHSMETSNLVSGDWNDMLNHIDSYIVFREILLQKPLINTIYYGHNKYISQTMQLEPDYQVKLDSKYNRLYDNNAVVWYWC